LNDWKCKLDSFLINFEYSNDVVGVLVCGSYITGNPTAHSDLDVHIILNNNVDYRERGNKIVEGLLIEYFANPMKQILRYFDDDLKEKSLMCQTQFATGSILFDKSGEVEALKQKAKQQISNFYASSPTNLKLSELDKYFVWDMLDDLQDAYKCNRADFDLLYYTRLNMLLHKYMNGINRPYNSKSIYGNVAEPVVREKYLLHELPDDTIREMIGYAITAQGQENKIDIYQKLTGEIMRQVGGFEIDGFKFKSKVDV